MHLHISVALLIINAFLFENYVLLLQDSISKTFQIFYCTGFLELLIVIAANIYRALYGSGTVVSTIRSYTFLILWGGCCYSHFTDEETRHNEVQ